VSDDRCRCPHCAPDEFASLPADRIDNNNHFGVQFGDAAWVRRVLLDGLDVTSMCCEAYASERGWAHLFHRQDGRVHRCPCGADNVCQRVVTGRVEVELRKPEAAVAKG